MRALPTAIACLWVIHAGVYATASTAVPPPLPLRPVINEPPPLPARPKPQPKVSTSVPLPLPTPPLPKPDASVYAPHSLGDRAKYMFGAHNLESLRQALAQAASFRSPSDSKISRKTDRLIEAGQWDSKYRSQPNRLKIGPHWANLPSAIRAARAAQRGHIALEHKAKVSATSPPDFRWYRYRDYFEAKRKPFSSRKIYQALLADPRRYHIHSYKQSNPVHQRVLRHLKIHDPFDTDDYEPDNTAVGNGFFGHDQQLIYDEPESYV